MSTDNARITATAGKSAILDVLWAAGPWRSSGDWWEEQAWAREEWDVAIKAIKNDAGIALYRIYRDEAGGGWFVEAEYD